MCPWDFVFCFEWNDINKYEYEFIEKNSWCGGSNGTIFESKHKLFIIVDWKLTVLPFFFFTVYLRCEYVYCVTFFFTVHKRCEYVQKVQSNQTNTRDRNQTSQQEQMFFLHWSSLLLRASVSSVLIMSLWSKWLVINYTLNSLSPLFLSLYILFNETCIQHVSISVQIWSLSFGDFSKFSLSYIFDKLVLPL